MCDPVSAGMALVGAASSVAGMASKSSAAAQRQAAIDSANRQSQAFTDAERQRQAGYTHAADRTFYDTLGNSGFDAQKASADKAGDSRYAADSDLLTRGATENQPTGASTDQGKAAVAQAVADALQAGKDHARAVANVSGVTDTTRGVGLNLGSSAQKIGTIGQLARASANAGGAEGKAPYLAIDPNTGRSASGIGDLLGGVGSGLTQGAIMGGGKGFGVSWDSLFGRGAYSGLGAAAP